MNIKLYQPLGSFISNECEKDEEEHFHWKITVVRPFDTYFSPADVIRMFTCERNILSRQHELYQCSQFTHKNVDKSSSSKNVDKPGTVAHRVSNFF